MAGEGKRHRKREAGLGKNITSSMEVLLPPKQFLLIARKKKAEYSTSLLSHEKKPSWLLQKLPSTSPSCVHYNWVDNRPLGKMPNHQGTVQKGAQVSLMEWNGKA